jgi:lysophospholipase L1-like esterase
MRSPVAPGPDFFSTYRDHAELRSDWVHPSSAGYAVMADQWGAALAGQGVACPQES